MKTENIGKVVDGLKDQGCDDIRIEYIVDNRACIASARKPAFKTKTYVEDQVLELLTQMDLTGLILVLR